MTNIIKQLTWCSWKVYDPYTDKYFTIFTVIVPKPSFEYPVSCLTLSLRNGKGKLLMRFGSLADLRKTVVVPDEYIERLEVGYRQALTEAGIIQSKLKALMHMDNIAPGSQIVRTDTGEIIAEAERILKGGSS